MSILNLIASYTRISKFRFAQNDDDDKVDKLSRKFSALLMIICAILLGTYQLVGSPIECWCPTELNSCDYAKA